MSRFSNVVIIGSGIGGLCSAAAVAPYAGEVQIYCKDNRPDPPVVRKSVPQGAHISILLQAGLNNLEKLFPGFREQLIEAGAAQIQAGTGQQIHEFGRWQPERELNLSFLGLSRPLLEHQVYLAVKKIDNVSITNQARIKHLCIDAAGKVHGVEAESFQAGADLVIDASGTGGNFVKQLIDATGQPVITEQRDIGIFYSTTHFKKPESFHGKKENILIVPEAGLSDIGGSLIDIEEETWCISLHGRNNAVPPASPDEWLSMAKNLPDSRIWQRASGGEMIGAIHTFKKPNAWWRRFDKYSQLPAGYLPVGDTISSVNPIFGQGITVAAGHAVALRDALGEVTEQKGVSHAYLEKAAKWSGMAWRKTRSHDENFIRFSSMTERKKQMLRELAMAHHQQIIDDPDAHLRLVLQSQMLL